VGGGVREERRQEYQRKHPSLASRYKLGVRFGETTIIYRTADSWVDVNKIRNGNS
jgi:hypothetical protein